MLVKIPLKDIRAIVAEAIRPPLKNKSFTIALDEEEFACFHRVAEAYGMTVAETIRSVMKKLDPATQGKTRSVEGTIRDRIIKFLIDHPNSSSSAIATGTGENIQAVLAILRELWERGDVVRSGRRNSYAYSMR